ncbi:hypothetical protein IL252_05220 [Halomicrobium sp. IBSBa]|uniref:hypothetical protein n=1 Tax=Halomicrobium sp. IBSBa TaxID=2778916 RepID=UPI001ABF4D4C|nr:hypothetical protein [Halomicrobium sp. IBSBa]MBO4247220.1 hypothetical protein [Halomicrobium sp. IBSBa]
MELGLVFGFLGLVVASYIGTTLALRRYFDAVSFEVVQRREARERRESESGTDGSSAED